MLEHVSDDKVATGWHFKNQSLKFEVIVMVVIAALYKFANLPDFKTIQSQLAHLCQEHGITGTLLLAQEGINGTVAGSRSALDVLKEFLSADPRFLGLEYKESFAERSPFYRMKVKLKKEIVTLGRPEANPSQISGQYVDASTWNGLLNDPNVTVIDVRNDYEVEIGTFKNALNPKTDTFREFPDFVKTNLDPDVHKKIAMYCTGGIRCEKASSYMKQQGFAEVYHLKGGILKYLEDQNKPETFWQGECFVFDNRVAVDENLKPGTHDLCHGCRMPINEAHRLSKDYLPGVSCPRCVDTRSLVQKAKAQSRQTQITIAKARGQKHLGATHAKLSALSAPS